MNPIILRNIEILFKIRRLLPMLLFACKRSFQRNSRHLSCVRRWLNYRLNSTEMDVRTNRLAAFWPTCSFWENQMKPLIKDEQRQSTIELAQQMTYSHVSPHLHLMGNFEKQSAYRPHALTETNKLNFYISASLMRLCDLE